MYSVKSMKGLLLAGMIGLTGLLAGCGGGGAGGTTTGGGTTGGTTTTSASIPGTAATGAAMAGATVTVKDASGLTVATGSNTVAADGTFTLTVASPASYSAPFMLRADPTPASPASGDEHYSLLLSLDTANAANNRVNITPITSLILYEATKRNLATVFATPALYNTLTSTVLTQARGIVIGQLTQLPNINFFNEPFTANGTDAYDAAMDTLDFVQLTFSGDAPTLAKTTGTVTYDPYKPLYPIQSLSVSPVSTSQTAGGTLNQISATLTNNQGKPAANVAVDFSTTAGAFPTTGGATASSLQAITNASGIATVQLKSPANLGTATITAASADGTATGSTDVTFVPGAPETISINAAPEQLAPGGTTTLTVSVIDSNGNPVADGQSITFTSSAADGRFAGFATVTRTTTGGLIVIDYTAGVSTGTKTITATAANAKTATKSLTITATPSSVAKLTLSTPTASLPADGVSQATISALVQDASNNPVVGVTVAFANAGGTLSASSAITNASGIATVVLTAGSSVLTSRTTASINGYTANADVAFSAGAVAALSINAAPNQVKPGGTSTLTVAAVDSSGNPVPNAPISLTFSAKGSGAAATLNASVGTTNAQGLLVVTYTAGASTGTDKLRAASGTVSTGTVASPDASIEVSPAYAVVGSVTTAAANASIPVGDESLSTPVTPGSTLVRATVLDTAGQPISGYTVSFSTTAGTLDDNGTAVSAMTATTDANGIASVTLTAGKTRMTAQVSASAGGFSHTASVSFTAGAADTVTLSAAPTTVRPNGTSNVYALVIDVLGNPVVGETVTFSIPTRNSGLPGLNTVTAITNQNGLASVVYTAGADAGTDQVNAITSNGKTPTSPLSLTVSNTTPVVASVTLTAGATTVQAGGSVITLRARVLDISGAPAVGIGVTFSATAGTVGSSDAMTTDNDGYAETTLTSPDRVGTITAIANAAGFLSSQDITVVAGNADHTKSALSISPGKVIAGGTATMTAIVLDANNNPLVGQTVSFAFKTNGNKTGGSISPLTSLTNVNGIATATYTGGNVAETDTLLAVLTTGDSTEATVDVTGGALSALAIGTSRTSVKSDNSEAATITVTALSSQNVVVPGVTVSFSAEGGQLNAAQVVTDASGKATVSFTSGTQDKTNRTVVITATAANVDDVQIPIQVVDSAVLLQSTATTLTAGAGSATITVTARDAGGIGVYNVPVTFSQSVANALTITALAGYTDVNGGFITDANGQFKATVAGTAANTVTLTANALGASASQAFSVLPGTTFAITAPLADPAALTTAGSLAFTVNAPTQSSVRFATSIGGWTGACAEGGVTPSVCTVPVVAGSASASLTSTLTGTANVQVDGLDGTGAVTGTDTHTVYITATSSASISLQGSASNVQPSTGGTANTVTLIATVRDAGGQPVGNVPVAFSILNTTGGGETITPVIKLSSNGTNSTDPLGQARAIFTAGSLPSGQSAASIQVQAKTLDSSKTATFNIVVGGSAGSVVIGKATHITNTGSVTQYTLPMSVLVADANGNPVPAGTVVSLSAWPASYTLGSWRPLDTAGGSNCVPTSGPDTAISVDANGDGVEDNDYQYTFTTLANEDVNENLILDTGEDLNGDGTLTPANSASGTLPASVVTDANGVANFNLIYLKQYAVWVRVRVRASTLVQGTEANSQVVFTLPALKEDADACILSNSPFPPYE